jgi:hypothetical protein
MKISELKKIVLINPAKTGFTELFIVSGYASATFLNSHLKILEETINCKIKIHLIIGMPGKRVDHLAYINLRKNYSNQLYIYYLDHSERPPCHAKVYSWCNKNGDSVGFSGSSNYSQNGFDELKQTNQMVEDDGQIIRNFFNDLQNCSIPVNDYCFNAEREYDLDIVEGEVLPGDINVIDKNTVQISYLGRNGQLPKASGLNWAQTKSRKELNRAPNQAYFRVPKKVHEQTNILPERGKTFTLVTDDNKSFDCVVAQDNGKAIESTFNNELLGEYIRNRIGVASGMPVTKEDLIAYGRTDYTLKYMDDETLYFDFKSN